FRPAVLPDMPISITTVPPKRGEPPPYDDQLRPDGLLSYRYRGTDPDHPDNVGLRLALRRRAPLVYHYGIVPGRYLSIWPVYIVGDDPAHLTFTVAVDDARLAGEVLPEWGDEVRRSYVARVTLQRLHQHSFRERVLRAYREQCAVCRLRHAELLEAAHILPDRHPLGEPTVPNGLALCKLHHAAFDRHILGVRPDLVIQIRRDILEEVDGPMLLHGLQHMHGSRLHVPRPAARGARGGRSARRAGAAPRPPVRRRLVGGPAAAARRGAGPGAPLGAGAGWGLELGGGAPARRARGPPARVRETWPRQLVGG